MIHSLLYNDTTHKVVHIQDCAVAIIDNFFAIVEENIAGESNEIGVNEVNLFNKGRSNLV